MKNFYEDIWSKASQFFVIRNDKANTSNILYFLLFVTSNYASKILLQRENLRCKPA